MCTSHTHMHTHMHTHLLIAAKTNLLVSQFSPCTHTVQSCTSPTDQTYRQTWLQSTGKHSLQQSKIKPYTRTLRKKFISKTWLLFTCECVRVVIVWCSAPQSHWYQPPSNNHRLPRWPTPHQQARCQLVKVKVIGPPRFTASDSAGHFF